MRLDLTIELPENLQDDQRQAAAKAAQEAAILTLFRNGAISSRVAAQVLGLSYYAFLDRLAELRVPVAREPLAASVVEVIRQQTP
jgi:predicted HTH domain antitoxin